MVDVALNGLLWQSDNRPMAWENQMRLCVLESLQLFNVFVHVAGLRGDEYGSNSCYHITGDQPSITEKSNMSGVVTRGYLDLPRLVP